MAGKLAKKDVGYTRGMPHCGVCRHYREEEMSESGSCELVAGPIDEDMWCKLFEWKASRRLAAGGAS